MFKLIALFFALASAQTIVELAVKTPSLSTLVKVLTDPNYKPVLDALSGAGPFTVFAPSNEAFARANIDIKNVTLVTAVLTYHVIGAAIKSTDLKEGTNIAPTLMKNPDYVNIGAGKAQVLDAFRFGPRVFVSWNGREGVAEVTTADVTASNGVVHIIDRVLGLPEDLVTLTTTHRLRILLQQVVKAELAAAVTGAALTIFAPTDEAFFRIPNLNQLTVPQLQNILKFHVVAGVAYSTSLVNNSPVTTLQGQKITPVFVTNQFNRTELVLKNAAGAILGGVLEANIISKNGVVHVVDRVLIPTA